MILSMLNDCYHRLASENRVPPPGFSSEKISFCLVFSKQGNPLQIIDLRDVSGKKSRPIALHVPVDKRRTSGIHAYPLWDKTAYALGVTAGDGKRLADEHAAFKNRQSGLWKSSDDFELGAFLNFLTHWSPNDLEALPGYTDEMLDANVVFRLDGEHSYLHENKTAHELWLEELGSDEGLLGECLVTGEVMPLGVGHPAIRGVRGAQSAGASLVSFNSDAYESYGHKGQANASISKDAIFGYSTALNYLLRGDAENHQRLQIGDTTTVFWAESQDSECAEAAEGFFAMLNEPPTDAQESAKLASLLSDVAKGRPLAKLNPLLEAETKFFVLGLAPNAARLSVRFWYTDSLERLAQHYTWHHQDLNLEPTPWKGVAPAMWRLLYATAPSRNGKAKAEDVAPQLAGELARAIFTGSRYPYSLLSNIIMRMRNDGDISGIRIALCKAVLARKGRLSAYSNATTQEVPVSLDRHSTHPGYLLGRLFAELENAQRGALGGQVNATIRDCYYGAASATPANIFPMLLRNVQNHLSNMRKKDNGGLAHTIESEIAAIIDGLGEKFPRSLHIEDQGRFAIGYYHQSQAKFVKKEKVTAAEATEGDK
ncbi:MAG: type I-C CRISPR-associated protein Cas8c/Csd1 [Alteromonadaceae bacterium]|nr:type I-C CRISPR-associated protein Cas8c/Csd1 [Alteromonadaceae bacterium]